MSRYSKAFEEYGIAVAEGLLADETFTADIRETGAPEETNAAIFHDFARQTDPSANHASQWKYLDWICRAYLTAKETGSPIKAEDFYKIKSDLEDFEAFQNILPSEQRDIYGYGDYQSLLDTLLPYQQKRDAKKAQAVQIDEKIKRESSILYDGPEGRVVMPHTKDASIFWGQQTRWCIAAAGSANYFHNYNDRSPLYIYMPKPSERERETLSDLSSFKFCATNGRLYNELDQSMNYTIPSLTSLFEAAASALDNPETKRNFFMAAPFDNLTPLFQNGRAVISQKDELIRLISENPGYYRLAAEELKADPDCAKAVLARDRSYYRQIPQSLYSDPEIARTVYKYCQEFQDSRIERKLDPFLEFAFDNHPAKILTGLSLTGAFAGAALAVSAAGSHIPLWESLTLGGVIGGAGGLTTGLVGGLCLLATLAATIKIEKLCRQAQTPFKSHDTIVNELKQNIPQQGQPAAQI